MSYDCRTIHWRMLHDIRATFVRHSRDTRTMYARCNCEYLLPSTASRHSHKRRAFIVRLSHDGFARSDKPRKMNILASIETSDYQGTALLGGTRGLEAARLLEGVTLLGVLDC